MRINSPTSLRSCLLRSLRLFHFFGETSAQANQMLWSVHPESPDMLVRGWSPPIVGEVCGGRSVAAGHFLLADDATGWGDWVNAFHIDKTDIDPALNPADDATPDLIDLLAYDGKKTQLRWHYFQAFFDCWFAIDEVKVSGVPAPQEKPRITGMAEAANKVSLSWGAFGTGQYTVQHTDNLVGGTWTSVSGMPITTTNWSGEDISAIGRHYYRVLAPLQ